MKTSTDLPRPLRPLWALLLCAGLSACVADVGTIEEPPTTPVDVDEEDMADHWDRGVTEKQMAPKSLVSVSDLINSRTCSTGPAQRLNIQIAEEVNCARPGLFESLNDIPNLRMGSGANPFLQKEATQALRRALASRPGETLQLNSSWRSVVQQQILKSWEGSCGISLAARPGRSNHESGLAIDIQHSFYRELTREGFVWHCDRTNRGRMSGCNDVPHWEYGRGQDLRSEGVKAFQRLWNKANPADQITVDGIYGSQTASRILKAPLAGFSTGTTCTNGGAPPEEPAPIVEDRGPGTEERTLEALTLEAQGRATGTTASVWHPEADLPACAAWNISEDFSSGRYNLHRYRTPLQVGGVVRVRLERTSGSWQPALFIVDEFGELIYAGDADAGHGKVDASPVADGRSGAAAEVSLDIEQLGGMHVYVTSWAVADSALSSRIPRDARYRLSMTQSCQSQDANSVYRGLTHAGMEIPRSGLRNNTLRGVHGISTEPYGDVVRSNGLVFVQGRTSWFGGPNDTGVSSTETGAITGERLRSLNSPTNPSASNLASRPEDFYFIAMRWAYPSEGGRAWARRRLLVFNPATGASVVVRPVDWGPNVNTRRVMDLSPQAMRDLGLTTDELALVGFVDDNTPLGPLR